MLMGQLSTGAQKDQREFHSTTCRDGRVCEVWVGGCFYLGVKYRNAIAFDKDSSKIEEIITLIIQWGRMR